MQPVSGRLWEGHVLKNGDLNHQKWRLFMIFAGKAGDLKEKYDGLI